MKKKNNDDQETIAEQEPVDTQTEEEKRAFIEKIHRFAEKLKTMPMVIDAYVEEPQSKK